MYYFDKEKELDEYIKSANKINKKCTKENILGIGTYGVCFKISEKEALKITCDISEVCTSIVLKNGKYKSSPEIKSVHVSNNPNLWIIQQELCDNLSPKEKRFFSKFLEEIEYYDEYYELGTSIGVRKLFEDGELSHFEEDSLIFELIEALDNCSKNPLLKNIDLHEGNIMRSNGKLVIIDQKDVNLDKKRINLQEKIIKKYLANENDSKVASISF